jgi:hypothetical protein
MAPQIYKIDRFKNPRQLFFIGLVALWHDSAASLGLARMLPSIGIIPPSLG